LVEQCTKHHPSFQKKNVLQDYNYTKTSLLILPMTADLGTRLPFDTAVSPTTIIISPPFSLSDLQCIGYLGAVCISMQTDL